MIQPVFVVTNVAIVVSVLWRSCFPIEWMYK